MGDKLDANEKAAVEADCQALKDILAKSTPEEVLIRGTFLEGLTLAIRN